MINYDFKGFESRISLNAKATKDGRGILDRTYRAEGISQGGKMFWGGAFAMKNAVQQSTKSALDQIFSQLTSDLAISLASERSKTPTSTVHWDGKWFGRDSANQVYLVIQNGSVDGRMRTATGHIFDLIGTITENGQLRAAYNGDSQTPRIDVAGVLPILNLYWGGGFTSDLRMEQRP